MTRTYFLREIALYCQSLGLGTIDSNLFIGEVPSDVVSAIWLVEAPSPPPHSYVDTEYIVVDFWARSPHTDVAHALLDDVYQNLNRRYHYQTSNWYIHFSHALGSVVDTDRDAESGKLLRLSIQFYCRNLRSFS